VKSKETYVPVTPLKPCTAADAERYSDALSDAICWLDGFVAAGGQYHPHSIDSLRELNTKLKDALL
jgi:hypothetical protein